MAKIIHKKSAVVGKIPATADLDYGELALNYADGKLFYKASNNTIQSFGGTALSTVVRQQFTATAGQTNFNLTYTPGQLDVYLNGVKLVIGTDYTASSGTGFTLAAAAAAGDIVDVVAGIIFASSDWQYITNKPTTLSGFGITDAQPLSTNLTSISALTGTSGFLKTNGAGTYSVDVNTYITGNQNIVFSGDATGNGTTSVSLTLANSGVTAGTYTKVMVDAKGRVTNGYNLTSADLPTYTGTITSSQVTTALGFTPYNATNPSGYISGNQTITFTGDATGSGATTVSLTLANSGVVAGTYGSSTAVPVVVVDAKGRVTSISTQSISGSLTFTGDVTGTGTTGSSTALTLANSGVVAGTYTKITVDAKGRATSGTTLSASDIPSLDASKITSGVIDAARLPSYVDDVLEYTNLASFPATGESGKIYLALDTNKAYRWSGSAYVYITSGAVDSVAGKTGVVTLTNADVGLANVENKSSATIRGEITSSNVITALGFTPYNSTNPSGYQTAGNINAYFGSPTTNGTLDWNDVSNTKPGAYGTLLLGSAANGPGISSYFHPFNLEYSSKDGTGNVTQMAIAYGSPGNQLYMRGRYSGSWSSWVHFLNSGNYSTYALPITGGVLSGSVQTVTPASSWGVYSKTSGYSNESGIWFSANVGELLLRKADGSLSTRIAADGSFAFINNNNILHAGNYTSYSPSLTGSGASGTWSINVTGNANTASTLNSGAVISGNAYFRKNQTAGDYTTAALWTESYGNTTTGVAFHISGVVGKFLEMRTNGTLYWNGDTILHSGNYTSYFPSWSTGVSGNHLVQRDGNGYIYANHVNFNTGVENPTIANFITDNGDGWSRKSSLAHVKNSIRDVADGTWGISITGNAATATSADNIDGRGFRNTGANDNVNADTLDSNGITYYTAGVTNFSGNASDGALYSQAYSSSWQHQIAGDYRSGQIALRGKNNGTWQAWRTVLDSSNYSSYALPLSGGTIGDTRINFASGGGGGFTFSSNHYSMGLDVANGSWSHPHYRDLIIGYHTGIRIGAAYSGIRFYNNSPTTDANNDGNGDGGESLLMTVGGHAGGSGVIINNTLSAGNALIGGNQALHANNYSSYALPLSGGTVSGTVNFNSVVNVNGRDIRPYDNDSYKEFYVGGDANTYYPVRFDVYAWFHFARWSISRGYGDTAPWDPIGTGAHRGGLTLTWEWSGDGAWGGNDKTIRVIQFSEQYTTMVGGLALSVNGLIVWLRGGNAYYRFHGPGGTMNGATPYYSTYTASNGSTYSPRSYDAGTVASEVTNRMPVRGLSELYDGGNRVLHLGNYSSYAVPQTDVSTNGGADKVLKTQSNGYLNINNWIQVGNSGLYSSVANGSHWYPNQGTYGSWQMSGSRNGYNGIEFNVSNGNVVLMINNDSNTSGFHNNSYGWQMRWNNGVGYIHKNAYGGGTAAVILDSVNYTNYITPASDSGPAFSAF